MTKHFAYYNEIDPYAVQWLKNLIKAGQIMDGEVDDRPIQNVEPKDLEGFTRLHFFAGIGGWDYALQIAEWPENRPVVTGSCPCQSLSSAGKRRGASDERHLWPEFFRIINGIQPQYIFGEQVASPLGRNWLSAVQLDLGSISYVLGATDLPAASVGAPHIRQRLFWMAHPYNPVRRPNPTGKIEEGNGERPSDDIGKSGVTSGVAHASGTELEKWAKHGGQKEGGSSSESTGCGSIIPHPYSTNGMADSDGGRDYGAKGQSDEVQRGQKQDGKENIELGEDGTFDSGLADTDKQRPQRRELRLGEEPRQWETWEDLSFIECTDGRARPTEPGLRPLAHGVPKRASKICAYGNAIVPQVGAAFISAFMEVENG